MATATIAPRFRGPEGSGNGGWTCGEVAVHLGSPAVEVTLRVPPPLEVAMDVVVDGDAGRLEVDGQVIAEGRLVNGVDAEPAVASLEEAAEATKRFRGFRQHAFPGCFTCGPNRDEGDGLRILAGPVTGQKGVVATPWDPPADLVGPDGAVDPRVVWAALDCPGAWAIFTGSDTPMVLGRLTAQQLAPVPVGERLVVTGRVTGQEGRKAWATSAVLNQSGTVLAVSTAVWILLDADAQARFAVEA